MSDKKVPEVVRPYVVDGIEEYDNPLPPWWVWLFNLTIVFSVAYMIWYHVMDKPGLDGELIAARQQWEEMRREEKEELAGAGGGSFEIVMQDPARIAEGKGVFDSSCAPCHGAEGQGTVGPNLVDNFWLHGGDSGSIIATITHGVPSKGMIAWETVLGMGKIQSVTAYILSLKGTTPAGAKAPEGEPYQAEGEGGK